MAKTYKVTLGAQAYSFNDQNTGFSISKGEVKELTARQYSSKKIRNAINNGYLNLVTFSEDSNPYSDDVVAKLKKKLEAQVARGITMEKLVKSYSMQDLTHLAKEYELELEKDDTPVDILTAIVEVIQEQKQD